MSWLRCRAPSDARSARGASREIRNRSRESIGAAFHTLRKICSSPRKEKSMRRAFAVQRAPRGCSVQARPISR